MLRDSFQFAPFAGEAFSSTDDAIIRSEGVVRRPMLSPTDNRTGTLRHYFTLRGVCNRRRSLCRNLDDFVPDVQALKSRLTALRATFNISWHDINTAGRVVN